MQWQHLAGAPARSLPLCGAVDRSFPSRAFVALSFPLAFAAASAFSACAPAPDGDPDNAGNQSDEVRVCATGTTVTGLDVSVYNGTVDWAAVKGSGRVFAIARVSDGLNYPDADFAADWSGIAAEGLVRGAYQYFRASQDAKGQADYFVSKIGTLGPNNLPPIIDVETDDGVSASAVVAGVRAWIDEVRAKTGVDPIIYCGSGFWDTLSNTSQFAGETLWVANYGASCPSMPSTWSRWGFWQYSGSGTVPGVSGATDLDYFNGTLANLVAFANGKGTSGSGSTSSSSSSSSASSSSSSSGGTSSGSSSSSSGSTSSSSSSSGGTSSSSSSSSSTSSSGAPPVACDVNGVAGTCIGTSACASKPGYVSTPGHCPGAASIECCTPPPSCDVGGVAGMCIQTSVCASMPGSVSTPGYCPGSTSEECCTPPPSCKVGNAQGACIQTSLCASMGGASTPGLCPGPASEECCTY